MDVSERKQNLDEALRRGQITEEEHRRARRWLELVCKRRRRSREHD